MGLVPTMGALHEGHLSLAREAARRGDRCVTSVFVNPTQFGPGEDFERYPRDLASDCDLLAAAGVAAVFAPAVETMYPRGAGTTIDVGPVARPLEGAARPTHFAGVATIVAKLFAILPAERAYFGQKDYQQTVVVRRMVADLDLPVEIVVCPIVRDPDGLAMSSRNAYLSAAERARALGLPQGLHRAERMHAAGERNPAALRAAVVETVRAVAGVEPEYVAVMRDGGVDEPAEVDGPVVVAVTARIGKTRLLDNVRLA